MVRDPEARRREIRRELRDIARRPNEPGAAARVAALRGEYRRLTTAARRAPEPSRPATPPTVAEQEAAAMKTWPPELRARVRDAALTRVVLPWRS
ncbi:hypothetical protein ABZY20_18885 [Streptomyces sp. NPDC006624]|uniref:hypothetical protein n=1 Tax=Streptomyces sp. NPDC006624 TaxID=3154892 RepID=UPI0033A2C1B3